MASENIQESEKDSQNIPVMHIGFDLYASALQVLEEATDVKIKKHQAKITEFKQALNQFKNSKIVHINADNDEFDDLLHTNAFTIASNQFESDDAEKTFDHRLASVLQNGGSVVVDVVNDKTLLFTITEGGHPVEKTFHGHDTFGFFSYPEADLVPVDELHAIKLNTYAVEDIFNYNGRYIDQAFDKKVIGYINITSVLSSDFFDATDISRLDMTSANNFRREIDDIFQEMNRLDSDHRFLVSYYDKGKEATQKFFDQKSDGSFFRSTDEAVCRYYIGKALATEGSIVLNKFKQGFYKEYPDVIYDSNAHAYVETKVYGLVLFHGESRTLSTGEIRHSFNTDHRTGMPMPDDPLRTFGSWSHLRIKTSAPSQKKSSVK